MKFIRKRDDRGITLVEVIVSMLILAIIIVPLLSSFVLSSRVNLQSRNRQYATTLASNVMESLKNYDLEDIALQFNHNDVVSGPAFQIVPDSSLVNGTYGTGFYEANSAWDFVDVSDETNLPAMSLGNDSGKYYFNGNDAKTYYYAINQVKEGTKEFDLQITIKAAPNPASGSAIKQNNYAIPDVTNLDTKETALINPSSVGTKFINDGSHYIYHDLTDTYEIDGSSTSYDQDALNFFINQHDVYIAQVKYEAELAGLPPPSLEEKSSTELQQKISRKTIITIQDFEEKILVTAKLVYRLNQGSESLVTPTNDMKEYGGFYELVGFDHLENIYLFHTPLLDANCLVDKGDVIEINNYSAHLGDDLNIFIAQQMVNGSYENIKQINVFGNNVSKLKFYYNEALSHKPLVSYNQTLFPLNSSNYFMYLVTDGDVKDRYYEVKVQVMEHGKSEVLNELTSTITR